MGQVFVLEEFQAMKLCDPVVTRVRMSSIPLKRTYSLSQTQPAAQRQIRASQDMVKNDLQLDRATLELAAKCRLDLTCPNTYPMLLSIIVSCSDHDLNAAYQDPQMALSLLEEMPSIRTLLDEACREQKFDKIRALRSSKWPSYHEHHDSRLIHK
jgi:hypothetical protein